MNYLSILIFSVALSACHATKKSVETVHVNAVPMTNPWTKIDFKPEKGMVLPLNYSTYALDDKLFSEQLSFGMAYLPDIDGSIALHEVKLSETMSEELQAKFPTIKSYAGFNSSNTLCQSRIDQKEDKFKIVIFCNDKTIYLQDLHDLGLYFIYDKKDLPEGVGAVKE